MKSAKSIFPGYKRVCSLRGRVHLILRAKEYIYVHAGSCLYRIERQCPDKIKKPRPIAYLRDGGSVGLSLGNRIVIADGERIIGIDNDGSIRLISEDRGLASCKSMAVWDGRLFLGGFDKRPDMLCFSSPLLGGLPQSLADGEIWLDGILEIHKIVCNGDIKVFGRGGVLTLSGQDGNYHARWHRQQYTEKNDILYTEWMGKKLFILGHKMEIVDQDKSLSYIASNIAGFLGAKRLYKYSPDAPHGFRVHKNPHSPCQAEVMSLTSEMGNIIYFSVEEGKRYALYRTDIMVGGSPIDASAVLGDEDRLWMGNLMGDLLLYGGEDDDGLFDGHVPEFINTKED